MSASTEFRRFFSKKSLENIYFGSVRYRSAVGIDRINKNAFENNLANNIDVIYRKVQSGTYRFSQYREKLISRGQKKLPRVISIPTLRDKLTQKGLFEVLNSVFGNSLQFVHQIIGALSTIICSGKYEAFLRLDVKDFYPSIQHDHLIKMLRKRVRKKEILSLIESALKQATVSKPEGRNRTSNHIGVPQGLSISNILANTYMLSLDLKHESGSTYKYCRYVDDILILCDYNDVDRLRQLIVEDCDNLGLRLHTDYYNQTKATSGKISEGFIYLGYYFKPSGITVRKESIDLIRESIIKIFTNYKYSNTRDLNLLKWSLNLRITGCIFNNTKYGWLFFFSQIDDLSLLSSLDHFIKKQSARFGIAGSEIKLKKFVRAYHEITKNLRQTKYIPNFDDISIREKRRVLSEVFRVPDIPIREREIEYQFNKRIYRSVRDLEKDLTRAS